MGIIDAVHDRREGPFTVLFVCTGNICRSPQAEALLRAKLLLAAERLAPLDALISRAVVDDIRVVSAGTGALVGHAPPAEVVTLTAERGADVSAYRARQLDDSIIDDADLILVMEREHRRKVVSDAPRATRRTFTLREFAHWSRAFSREGHPTSDSTDLAQRLRDALPEISAQRALLDPIPPQASDVADPYRRTLDDYRAAATTIDEAVDEVVAAFLGVAMKDPTGR